VGQVTSERSRIAPREDLGILAHSELNLAVKDQEPPAPADLRPETAVICAGRPRHAASAPLNTPVVLASNFRTSTTAAPGMQEVIRSYARTDATPTWEALETALGQVEGGHAVAFSSGMAAVDAVLDLVPAGGRIVAPKDCYFGVGELLADAQQQGRWVIDRVDLTDTASVQAAAAGADLLWLETPSNPLLDIADLPALCAADRSTGAIVGVDNTFATPLLQQPLALGADVAVHSATKFIGGHSDLLAGITVARDQALAERLRHRRGLSGATPGALEAFLALRGLRTLALRLDRGQRNAGELARRLDDHPAVSRVRYPGLPSHPGHHTAAAQMTGFGAVLAFEVADAPTADRLCDAVHIVVPATSLGGVESTIERRSKLPGQGHLPSGLLRLSAGCEHIDDLWNDLDSALKQAARAENPAANK
jgi:cystathionine gamma-synthase